MATLMPRVCLKIVGAKGVGLRYTPDAVVATDVYCSVGCGAEVVTTETKNKTTMPVWKQDVELGLSQPLGTTLTFQVCAVKNAELLGQAIVDISSLAPDQTVTQTLVLKKDPASAEAFGELTVEMRYEPEYLLEPARKTSFVDSMQSAVTGAVKKVTSTVTKSSSGSGQPGWTASTTTTTTATKTVTVADGVPITTATSTTATTISGAVAAATTASTTSASSTTAASTAATTSTGAVAGTRTSELRQSESDDISSQSSVGSPTGGMMPSPTDTPAINAPNFIVVTVLEAKGVKACDGSGTEATSDPFVRVHCTKNQSQKTHSQKKTLHPRWRQRFYFHLTRDANQVLEFIVEDKDMITDDFMGRCSISVDEWKAHFDSAKKVFWLALEPKPQAGAKTAFSDISPTRKMSYDLGKLCLAIELRYMDRKLASLEQGETDNVTVVPNSRGLRALSSVSGAGGAEDEAGDEDNLETGDDVEGDDEEDEEMAGDEEDVISSKQEKEEERKKEEEERHKKFAELSNVQFASGDYQIRVRIIEVRDLTPKDLNGLCDPVVSVECLGQRQHTVVRQKQLSCVIDEYLYFNFKNLDKDTVQQGSIKVSVLDADGPKFKKTSGPGIFDDMIGFFNVDIPYVYLKKDHEIHRRWVALVGDDKSNSDSIQGYLLLSIVVLGPGDKLKIHDKSEEKNLTENLNAKSDINSMVLVPPRVNQTLKYFVMGVDQAIELPDMDQSVLKTGGIDGYVRVNFMGLNVLDTKIVTVKGNKNLAVEFRQELWFPVLVPCMSNNIFVSVWDNDLAADELVANILRPFNFSTVIEYPEEFKSLWVNLYGPPLGYVMQTKARKFMHDHPVTASTYRGRVLLSLRVEDGSKSVNEKPHVRNMMNTILPPRTKMYTLRAALMYGTEVPHFPSRTSWSRNSRMSIRISIGRHSQKSTRVDNTGGICHWNQYLDIPQVELPEDLEQVPDVFVHLVRQQLNELRYICYARYSAKDLFYSSETVDELKTIPPPEWVTLVEDPVFDDLKDHEFTGNILMNMRLEPAQPEEIENVVAQQWRQHVDKKVPYTKYTLFVHVFQGRCLPAADANGTLDPYVKVFCAGAEGKVATKASTRDPNFYETVTLQVELPQDQVFLPKVSVQIFDWDQWDSDDYVGGAKFSLTDFPTMTATQYIAKKASGEYAPPRPNWYPICYQRKGDTEGELLLSFDLVKMDTPGVVIDPPESIRPPSELQYLEIICLGCRDVQPVGFMPVNTPFVKFDIGEASKSNRPKYTNPSSKPSGRNPNFLERIVIPVRVPLDALYAPRLNISVYDQLLGGFYKPLLGVCSVDLSSKLQFSNGEPNPAYRKPGGTIDAGNPYIDRPDDLSSYPGVIPDVVLDAQPQSGLMEGPAAPAAGEEMKKEDLGVGVFSPDEEVLIKKTEVAPGFYDEDDEDCPHYLKNRATQACALEEELDTPFESYSLFRGDMLVRQNFFTRKQTTSDYRAVGRFKGIIRVMKNADEPPLFDLDSFLKPQPYLVRVYVLDALDLQTKDENNKCDPYLRLSLGDGRKRSHMINDREHHCKETTTPKFHKMYEFKADLPGASELRLEVLDYDYFAIAGIPTGLSSGLVSVGTIVDGDDFVGATLIDLEDRWFSQRWQQLGAVPDQYEKRKPLETRPLFAPSSSIAQGSIRLWVDILTPQEMGICRPLDISLPPIEKFEVRVIIYKARNVTPGDFTDLSDLMVKVWLQNKDEKAQTTDVHWRAKNGKASFNWRMKFDLELPIDPDNEADRGDLHFQMWDKDILYDDCLAEAVRDLGPYLKEVYKTKQAVNVFAKKKPVRVRGTDSMPYSDRGVKSNDSNRNYSTQPSSMSVRDTEPSAYTAAITVDDDESERPLLSSTSSSRALEAAEEKRMLQEKRKAVQSKENAESLVKSIKQRFGMGDDPDDAQWLVLKTKDSETGEQVTAGELLVSIEILPIYVANARAAGLGRSEPNNFPFLPEPADRLHLSAMWNPLNVLEALMGPKFYRAFSSCMVCSLFVALVVFAGPLVNVFLEVLQLLPSPFGWIVFAAMLVSIVGSIFYCSYRCRHVMHTHSSGSSTE